MKTAVMKSVLGVLVLVTSLVASADENVQQNNVGVTGAPAYSVVAQNRASNGRSVWVTMYNMFGSVREARCLRDGQDTTFSGYYPPLEYYIRAEVKENLDCSGGNLDDIETKVEPTRGVYAKVLSYPDGGRERYMWRVTMSPESVKPRVRPLLSEEQVAQVRQDSLQVQGGSTIEAHNALRNGKSVWVTIYNVFQDIRDSGCVQPGERRGWGGYYDYGFAYSVRFEVKDGPNCSGVTLYDNSIGIRDVSGLKGARIMNINEGGQSKYILANYE
ncbi:hypothetical protein QJS83_00555 [Bdellovibrio sp. 22V]|uniref:hypothetical protein n=1 Tax=Bdellovibrio TaxID=958 RepID=UPI0025434530|nr:hypothetical protein [Bdellovibrio sp. 22V]WII72355.1 hypothetical protein QJS83_00555 [Bdellovibrio sp. 22V]